MAKNSGGASKGGTGSGCGGKGGTGPGPVRVPNLPSTTGNPSGRGRGNAPPRNK